MEESVRLNGAPNTARPGKLDLIMSLFRLVKILYHARSRLCATCLFFLVEKLKRAADHQKMS
jgi:hypothetical protein